MSNKKPTKTQLEKQKLLPHEMEAAMPRVLKDFGHSLFPNSPIEVLYEHKKFAVYAEGQWVDNEDSIAGIRARIREVLKSNQELWATRATYINPTWPGWQRVDMASLYELIGVSHAGGVSIAS